MDEEFQDQAIAKPANAEQVGWSRGAVSETLNEGDTRAVREEGGDSFRDGGGVREIPQSVLEKIDAIAKRNAPASAASADPPEETDPDSPAPGATEPEVKVVEERTGDQPAAAPGQQQPPVPDPKAAAPDPAAEHRSRADRAEAANRKLIEEIEGLKKRPAAPPANKLLLEAHDTYLENSVDALHRFVAANLGLEDPKDPRVAQEVKDLYADLTAGELGVTPDPAHQAKREAARTRQLWDREKRQRTADEQKKATDGQQDADSKAANEAAAFIAPRLQQKASDYPLLTNLAEVFDGMKPEALIWKVIERETKTGRLRLGADDDANIAAAAKFVEDHYASLVDRVHKAKPQINPSTAPPSGQKPPAAAPSASKETRQSHGARTLTAADASVAPATPPAQKPTPPTEQKPKFRNNEERKNWALRHLDKR